VIYQKHSIHPAKIKFVKQPATCTVHSMTSTTTTPRTHTAPSYTPTSSISPHSPSTESTAKRKISVDKVRAKWEQATFGKAAKDVTLEEHVKNLSSTVQEVRRASAEQLRYFQPEVLRPIAKLLLNVASTDSDTWTASYAYRAYLRQLKERELKINPDTRPTA
jgi:hypothetical protein